MKVQVEIKGLEQVLATMLELPKDVRMKGARFAGRKGANLIRDAAIRNAQKIDDPQTAQAISKNIVVRFASRRFKRSGDIGFRVGVLGGSRIYAPTRENVRRGRAGKSHATAGSKDNPGGDTWYWRLVEFGTRRARAQPFMRPALENNIEPATAEFAKQLDAWLARHLRKTGGGS